MLPDNSRYVKFAAFALLRPCPVSPNLSCLLLRWQIQDRVTRSSTALDQLLASRSGGPLAQIINVPNMWRARDSPETLPLACLTGAGRAHYAAHWAAYRGLYSDVAAPPPEHAGQR